MLRGSSSASPPSLWCRRCSDHEHHAGLGHRTHPRNRHPQGAGRETRDVMLQFLIEAATMALSADFLASSSASPSPKSSPRSWAFPPPLPSGPFSSDFSSPPASHLLWCYPAHQSAQLDPSSPCARSYKPWPSAIPANPSACAGHPAQHKLRSGLTILGIVIGVAHRHHHFFAHQRRQQPRRRHRQSVRYQRPLIFRWNFMAFADRRNAGSQAAHPRRCGCHGTLPT